MPTVVRNNSLETNMRRFDSVHARARINHLWRRLARRPDSLPTLQGEGADRTQRAAYQGVHAIPVARIVGSEGRSDDFTRDFRPRRSFMAHRWARIDAAFDNDIALPAIQVLEIDSRYFVRDGNHRVSVAKVRGLEFLDAEVTKLS